MLFFLLAQVPGAVDTRYSSEQVRFFNGTKVFPELSAAVRFCVSPGSCLRGKFTVAAVQTKPFGHASSPPPDLLFAAFLALPFRQKLYESTMKQIEEFGQAPAQLFKSPHPRRLSIAQAEVVRPIASPVPGSNPEPMA